MALLTAVCLLALWYLKRKIISKVKEYFATEEESEDEIMTYLHTYWEELENKK